MAIRKLKSPFDSYVQHVGETAPHTEIVNRAKVSRSFQAIMGTERILIPSINKIGNESGPNGEEVFETDEADSRIRFVGTWDNSSGPAGTFPKGQNTTEYMEVTFYGTGLNLLSFSGGNGTELKYTLDGGIQSANFYPTNGNSVLESRSYSPHVVLSVVNGLTRGWHTVKINLTVEVYDLNCSGIEILNESDDIVVCAGKGHANGYEVSSDVDVVVGKYNTGFENVLDANVGTKGGRVVVYTDPKDNVTKKALTKVDATTQYLTSADHSNESVQRVINFREFGRNRADDFSTTTDTVGDDAFTLDDGVTTLVGRQVVAPGNLHLLMNNGYWFTLTFVGTGLDIVRPTAGEAEIFIDGVSVGNLPNTSGTGLETIKICSGLPQGTHTVKFSRETASAEYTYLKDFIIYQPKKPTIPEGAIIHGEYSLMADFIANTVSSSHSIATGVIRKNPKREYIYSGAWSVGTFPRVVDDRLAGEDTSGSGTSSFLEHAFLGTGFDFRGYSNAAYNDNISVTLNGTPMTLANFPSLVVHEYAGSPSVYNTTSGVLDTSNANVINSGIAFSGLPLASYVVRFTLNAAATVYFYGLDVITPIYNMDTYDGSMGIKDSRNFNPLKTLNKRTNREFESFCFFDHQTLGGILKSKNISQVMPFATGKIGIYFKRVYVDKYTSPIAQQHTTGHTDVPSTNAGITHGWGKGMVLLVTRDTATLPTSYKSAVNFKAELEQDLLEE